MSRYKRRIIIGSITIHVVGLSALFLFWLLNPDLEIPKKDKKAVPDYQLAEGEGQDEINASKEDEIPDTGIKPTEDFEEGDLKNEKLQDLVRNATKNNLTTEEKARQLTENFKALSRTPVKEVDRAAETVLKAFGGEKEAKGKMKARYSKENPTGAIDINSLRLYDFEIVDDKYALIYKDKNNVYIKNDPVSLETLDSSTKMRLNLIKKAKENKKVRILLDTTENLLNILNPPPKEEE